MENLNHPLFNWIPYKLIEKDNEIYFEWIYLADIKYADPFFDESIAKCKSQSAKCNGKCKKSYLLPFKVITLEPIIRAI